MASKKSPAKGRQAGVKGRKATAVEAELSLPEAPEVKAIEEDSSPTSLPMPEPEGAPLPAKPVAKAKKTAKADAQEPTGKIESEQAKAAKPRMLSGLSPRPKPSGNPYQPMIATVLEYIRETPNICTLRVRLDALGAMESFEFEPGQVGQLSVFGAGEATFVINSPPSQKDYLQFSVMRTGEVTDAIHRLAAGAKVGVRAPLGNYFPYADWKGRNVFFIGGGIGMAPIRTIMLYLLEHKADYGKISLLYGARSPRDMAYSYELDAWKHNPDLDCTLCIDNPDAEWGERVGLIPTVLKELKPSPENCVAVLCGPPIMIKFTLEALEALGFAPENIFTTLEKRMKCGIGICGRCNIGDRYVCVDGPVFSLKELQGLPPEL